MSEPQPQPHPEEPQRSWFRRQLMRVFGPPDLGPEHQGNPLRGTKYDPELKSGRRGRHGKPDEPGGSRESHGR